VGAVFTKTNSSTRAIPTGWKVHTNFPDPVHQNPGEPWTLANIAKTRGVSHEAMDRLIGKDCRWRLGSRSSCGTATVTYATASVRNLIRVRVLKNRMFQFNFWEFTGCPSRPKNRIIK
jgi:hypothetical protein